MSILTEAGKDAVDQLSATVEEIEEQVRERIYDEVHGAEMAISRHGDYLEREAVIAAVKRGAW